MLRAIGKYTLFVLFPVATIVWFVSKERGYPYLSVLYVALFVIAFMLLLAMAAGGQGQRAEAMTAGRTTRTLGRIAQVHTDWESTWSTSLRLLFLALYTAALGSGAYYIHNTLSR